MIFSCNFFLLLFVNSKKASIFALAITKGAIAQLVEQRTENPCVPGSIPGGTTKTDTILYRFFGFYMAKARLQRGRMFKC